jgi:ribosomal-protein-alanine N-acetyltransferase
MSYTVRRMRLEDIPEALDIDRECFAEQWASVPYKRDLETNDMAHYLVVGEEDVPPSEQQIDGIMGFWVMAGEAHIITIAVRPARRRQGIAEALLIAAIELAVSLRAHLMTLEVRQSNTAAQAMYRKYGFDVTGTRKKYYNDNGEDAVIMSTETLTGLPFQESLRRLKQAHAERVGGIDHRVSGLS